MRVKILFLVLASFIFILSPLSVHAFDPATIQGTFSRVPGQKYKFDGKTVEVIEFMSFYCGHCYAFAKSIPIIKGNFPRKIRWRVVPVYWGNGSSKPGEAYLLAEDAGKGERMKRALFKAYFEEKKDIGNPEALEAIAAEIGLGFDFSRRLRAGEKAREAEKALEMAKAYGVDETPTVIIAGDLMPNFHLAGGDMNSVRDNIITIVKSILGTEK